MIYTYHGNRQRLDDMLRLWLSRCDKVYIFSDEQWVDPFFNISTVEVHPACTAIEKLSMANSCKETNMWGKLWQMWLAMNRTWCVPNHVLAERGSAANVVPCDHIDFLLVNGDDVLVIMENLRQFLHEVWTTFGAREHPRRPLYIGNFFQRVLRKPVAARDPALGDFFTYASGAGYLVNWALLQELLQCTQQVVREVIWSEDKMLSVCLEQRGVLKNLTVASWSKILKQKTRKQAPLPNAINVEARILMNLPSPQDIRADTMLIHYMAGKTPFDLSQHIYGSNSTRMCIPGHFYEDVFNRHKSKRVHNR